MACRGDSAPALGGVAIGGSVVVAVRDLVNALTREGSPDLLRAASTDCDVPLADLPLRERQIITVLVQGRSSPEIGEKLHLAPRTIDADCSRLKAQVGVPNVTTQARFASRVGLIDADPG